MNEKETAETAERFDLASQSPTTDRIEGLRALLPEAFTGDKVDFDALRRSLGDWIDPGPERFGLTWSGKAECIRVVQEASIGTLVPMSDESVDWDATKNVIIEGACMVWQGGRRNDSKLVSSGHDYILIYARDLPMITGQDLHWEERKEGLGEIYEFADTLQDAVADDFDEAHKRLLQWFKDLPNGHASAEHSHYTYLDRRGLHYRDNISSLNYRENLIYDF